MCYKCEYTYVTYVIKILITFVIKEIRMKERLLQLLDLEQLSPSKFADIIGVQRSSVSHVISGRNKPSFDFLQKTLKAFPGLHASWLMMGEGSMYEQMGRDLPVNLFDSAPSTGESDIPPEPIFDQEHADDSIDQPSEAEFGTAAGDIMTDQAAAKAPPAGPGERKVVQVMLIYDDDTFRTLKPSQ